MARLARRIQTRRRRTCEPDRPCCEYAGTAGPGQRCPPSGARPATSTRAGRWEPAGSGLRRGDAGVRPPGCELQRLGTELQRLQHELKRLEPELRALDSELQKPGCELKSRGSKLNLRDYDLNLHDQGLSGLEPVGKMAGSEVDPGDPEAGNAVRYRTGGVARVRASRAGARRGCCPGRGQEWARCGTGWPRARR